MVSGLGQSLGLWVVVCESYFIEFRSFFPQGPGPLRGKVLLNCVHAMGMMLLE